LARSAQRDERLQAGLARVEAEPDEDSERDLDEERIAKLLVIRRARAYTVVVWLDPGLAWARPSQTAFPRHFRFVGRVLELAED